MSVPLLNLTQRLRATIFAAVALVVLAGCASRPAPSKPSHVAGTGPAAVAAPSAITTTHAFAAFDPSGAPAAGVAAHRSGSCWTSSITVSARNAYRCLAGNHILDPCFAGSRSHAQTVYCYSDPWSGAVALSLHGSHLPNPGAPLKIAQPWAIALAGGIRCVVTSGAAPLLHGVPLRYTCASGPSGTAGLQESGGTLLHAWYQPRAGTARDLAVTDTWAA